MSTRRSARSTQSVAPGTGGSGRSSALEEIKKLRANGSQLSALESSSRVASYKPSEDSLFKTVTEDEYEELVRNRRSQLPFVENDDHGMGYFDDGEEQFFDSNDEYDDEEMVDPDEEDGKGKKRGAGALSSSYIRRAKKLQRAKLGTKGDQKITNMFFTSQNGKSKGGAKAAAAKGKKDIDLDSMLNDLTSNPNESTLYYAPTTSYSAPSKPSTTYTHTEEIEDEEDWQNEMNQDDDVVVDEDEDMEPLASPATVTDEVEMDKANIDAGTPEKVEPIKEEATPKLSKRAQLLRQKAHQTQLKTSKPTISHTQPPVKTEAVDKDSAPYMSHVPSNEVSEWWNQSSTDTLDVTSSKHHAEISSDAVHLFWMDAVEVRDRPGKLYLIGKKQKEDGSNDLESCCVVVNELPRVMYLVPKQNLTDMTKEERQEAWMSMHTEIRSLLIPSCITGKVDQQRFQSKLVQRDYAFEESDIPRGKNWYLKVQYAAKYPAPASHVVENGGKTFSRICGAFTRPLENFLIKRKLLGPGWISIKNVAKCKESTSFCTSEFETFDPSHVEPLLGQSVQSPPLKVASLSVKTVCNRTTGKHEVVALSALTESNVNPDGKGHKGGRKLSHFTCIRPLENGFPQEYVNKAMEDPRFSGPGDKLRVEPNERAMLSYFLNRLQREDPDVIVGHNLHSYLLDLIVSRIDHYKLGGLWSKITRLRRGRLTPLNMGEGWNEYRLDDLLNGRLLCDTYVSSKELLPSQSDYSLTYLVQSQLHKTRVDVEMTDLPQLLTSGADNFVKLLRHTLDDGMFVLQLMHSLEVLPLSKQLANLCGYLWPRTLEGNKRSERMEFLLLHEFSRKERKFLIPDKQRPKEKSKKTRKRDPAYAGGMVFAPQKGLYDNYVVLLDFMSLYPSIIREYNICFTTVDRKLQSEDEEVEVPPLPSSNAEAGVLPDVFKRLLESRKQVKAQLKVETKNNNVEAAQRLDIRQKAIKLTANALYGCLGLKHSRFHAKPIAALITATGRQTLQRAKEVAEQECGYDVVYGDTDSIMVDTKAQDVAEAQRVGNEVMAQCNKHFKLLELEVDYLFKTILLLNKKKYAALVVQDASNPEDVKCKKDVKGLDMVRRDWCPLSKQAGHDVLDVILSGAARDDVVDKIHDYLEALASRVRTEETALDDFVITKSLNKAPEQYPDSQRQPHVQVALALKQQGKPIGAGTHISYVMCKQEEGGSGRKAYHPEEVKRSMGKLELDLEWYLESQVHPPVNRLCAHIDGTSSAQLAHCLGLDTKKFSHNMEEEVENDVIPSVLQDDSERFQNCSPLRVTCRRCQEENVFPGVLDPISSKSGMVCPNASCGANLWGYDQEGINGTPGDDLLSLLSNKVHLGVREITKKYYLGWTQCLDSTCKLRTQKQSLRGKGDRCADPRCRSQVSLEVPDEVVYTQLKYFASLFDVERAQSKLEEKGKPRVNVDARHAEIFHVLHKQAEKTVRQNDFNWVKPSIWQSLFV